jgi:hypothetical protein
MKKRKIGRDAQTSRIIRIAEAKARKATATVETMTPRRRDREVPDIAAALSRLEAIVAHIERVQHEQTVILKDIRAGGRRNGPRHQPDWMSA